MWFDSHPRLNFSVNLRSSKNIRLLKLRFTFKGREIIKIYNYYSNGTEMVVDYIDISGGTVLRLQIQYKRVSEKIVNNSFDDCFKGIYNNSNQ